MKRANSLWPFHILLLASLFLTAAVSCSKNEGFDPLDKTPEALDNTTWVYTLNDSVPITVTDEEGEETTRKVDCTTTNYLLFQTKYVGTMKTEVVSKMHPALNSNTIIDFKYAYNRPTGKFIYTSKDELGHDIQAEVSFEVDGKKLFADWGSNVLVFTRRI